MHSSSFEQAANTKRNAWGQSRYFLLSALVIALDQWSKFRIEQMLPPYGQIRILPIFTLTRIYNRGAAFSFMNGPGAWRNDLFLAIVAIVAVVIGNWILRLPSRPRMLPIALSLTLGGALGNAIDRVVHGHVIDFILLHVNGWYYPAFNIADSAITIGAVLFVWSLLKR